MNNFTLGIILARVIAESEAAKGEFAEILPEHCWMALCRIVESSKEDFAKLVEDPSANISVLEEMTSLKAWFESTKIDATATRRMLRGVLGKGLADPGKLHRSEETRAAYEGAMLVAKKEAKLQFEMLHLCQWLFDNPTAKLRAVLQKLGYKQAIVAEPAKKFADDMAGEKTPQSILLKYGRDLTETARAGDLHAVIGRREEMRRIAQILSQRQKCNVLLVGDAGVGKTRLVEGLAQRIVSAKCPPAFKGKRVVELAISAILSGAQYRGEFEERLEKIIAEAEADPNLILFIDEFHNVMGAGKGSGPLDAANILKPALSRGKLKLIGATTTSEYEQHMARDEAMSRRFDVVWIEEPSRDEALKILTGVQPELEKHHGLSISKEALEAAVDLSIRYLPDRHLPDKAIDLLDQACGQRVIPTLSKKEGETAVASDISREDVARVVSMRCRVPYELLATSDKDRMNVLEEFLGTVVIGQSDAMASVARTIRSAYGGLRDPRRPVASFLFAGPTGVGKTETAKALANFLLGSHESLVHIDLSEYGEKHQVARLIGAPPGYVGYQEPGMLTSALRRRPASVVLFDEIEKAHPDVLNVLLQILDEGRLTDGHGRPASFRESIVIMTSNVGIHDDGAAHRMGFRHINEQSSEVDDKQKLIQELQNHVRPELLGRIGAIIAFKPLNDDAIERIVRKVYAVLRSRLLKQSPDLSLPERMPERLMEGFVKFAFGAREIERAVEARIVKWLEESKQPTLRVEDIPEDVFTVLQPKTDLDVALLILDVEKSTELIQSKGDTYFCSLIGRIHRTFEVHPSKTSMLFLKCTGDGFFAVYSDVPSALAIAKILFSIPGQSTRGTRMALHWGRVKAGPGGDPLGVEVHRCFRMESVKKGDVVGSIDSETILPESDRIIASRAAVEKLDLENQAAFKRVGLFRLKGFDDPYELFINT